MAGAADTRIMELQFENREFEKNIAKSQKSVEDLKAAMNFDETSSGLDKFAKGLGNLDFSKLSDNIQKLTDKFTGLGDVGELVISQIRRKIEEVAAKISSFVDSMTGVQVTVGMGKYDMLNKSVQTIKAATGETEDVVYGVLERLNNYTDQTSYNFSDMAQNIGKFTSVGIDLQSAERQMEGIANWAARSGAGINEASRAMYNLSQAMGVGKLTKIDWKSIENAGMATKEFKEQMMEAAVIAGTLEKSTDKNGKTIYMTSKSLGKQVEVTYQNVADTLSKGWANRDVVSATLERYYYEDLYYENGETKALIALSETQKKSFDEMIKSNGYLSASEYKTMTEASSLTNDTTKEILDFAVAQGKLTQEADKAGNTIYKAMDKAGNEISFTAEKFDKSLGFEWFDETAADVSRQKILDFATAQGKLKKEVDAAGKVTYKVMNKAGKEISFVAEEFEKSLDAGWFDENLAEIATSINTLALESYESAQKCLTFSDVIGAWKDQISTGWMTSFKTIFGTLSESMEFFSNVCNRVGDAIGDLIDLRNGALESWAAEGGRQTFIDLILGDYGKADEAKTGAYGLLDVLGTVKDLLYNGMVNFFKIFAGGDEKGLMDDPAYFAAWLGVKLKEVGDSISGFMKGINDFFNGEINVNGEMKTRLQVIYEIVDGIAGAFAIAWNIIQGIGQFMSGLGEDLTPGFDSVIGLFGDFGTALYGTSDSLEKADKFNTFFTNLRTTLEPITSGINSVITSIANLFRKIFGLDKEGAEFTGTFDSIGSTITKVADIIAKVAGPVLDFISTVIDLFADLISGDFSPESISAFGAGVGSAFETMIGSMPEGVQKAYNFIKTIFTDIKDIFDSGFSAESFSKFGQNIKTTFGDLWTKVSDLFTPKDGKETIFTKIGSFFTGIWTDITSFFTPEEGKTVFDKIGSFFKDLWGKIAKIFEPKDPNATSIFTKIGDFFKNLWERLKSPFTSGGSSGGEGGSKGGDSVFSKIGEWFKSKFSGLSSFFERIGNAFGKDGNTVFSKLKDFFSKINLGTILAIVMGGVGIGIIVKTIAKVVKLFKTVGKGLADLGDALKNGFSLKLKDADKKQTDLGTKLLKIAIAIGIITACLIAIGSMDPMAALQGVMYIITLMAAIALMSYAMKKIDSGGSVKDSISTFIGMYGMALAIKVLVSALMPLSTVNFGQFAQMMGGLVLIFIGLLFIGEIAKDGRFDVKNMGGLAATVASIALLIGALNLIKNSNIGQIATMLGTLVGIFVILYVFMKKVNENALSMNDTGMKEMIALAASIAILILALNLIKNSSWEQLGKIGAVLAGILVILYGFMFAVNKTGVSASGSGMTQILALAGSIFLICMALLPLTLVNFGKLMGATLAVVIIMGALVGFMVLTQSVTMKGSGMAQFLLLAASIVIIAIALLPLSLLNFGKLMGAVLAVSVLIIVLAGVAVLIGKTGSSLSGKGTVGFIAIALAIAVLVWALMPLSLLPADQLKTFLIGFLGVIARMAVLLVAINKLGDVKKAASGLLALLGLAVVMLAFSAAINLIKDVDPAVIAAFGVGLSALILAVAGGMKISQTISPKGILMLAAGIAAILLVLALILPLLIGNTFNALKGASADFAVIGEMLSVFGSKMGGVDEGSFDKAGRIIDKMKDIMFKLVGITFTEGFINAFMSAMAGLVLAADEIAKFKDRIIKAGPDGGTVIASFIIGQFKSLFENDLSGFETYYGKADAFYSAVYKLGSAFDYFDSMTATAGSPDDNNGLKLIKELADCASDLDIIYKMDLDKFKDQLAELGGAMILYAQGAKSVSGEEITEDTDVGGAITLLTKISDSLSQNGGFTIPDNMPSDTELTDFGIQLAALAGALVAFENAGQGLGTGTAEALRTLTFFRDLKTQLMLQDTLGTDLSSAINAFKDENGQFIQKDELTTFGEDIAQLGSSMAHFAKSTQVLDASTGEMKPIDYSLATTALTEIAGLPDKLPALSGLSTIISGKREDLGTFATELELLGTALSEFHTSTSTFDSVNNTYVQNDYSGATQFLTDISGIATSLNKIKIPGFNLESLWSESGMTLADLGKQISLLGGELSVFSACINGDGTKENPGIGDALKEENTNAVVSTVNSMISLMVKIGETLPKVGGVSNFLSGIAHGTTANLKTVGDEIGKLGPGLNTFATEIQGKFQDTKEIDNAIRVVDSFVETMSHLVTLNTESFYGDFRVYAIGLNDFLDGIMNGFEYSPGSNIPALDNIISMARYISTAMNEAGDIDAGNISVFETLSQALSNFASIEVDKVDFEGLGTNIAAGVQAGIESGTSGVITAAVEMATAAYTAAKEALDINSPSKVFAFIGRSMGEGMAVGADNSVGTVISSVDSMTDEAITTAGNLMATISRIMTEGTDTNPTISPVLDLTNLQSGMVEFGRSLTGYGVSLDASTSAGFAGRIAANSTAGYSDTYSSKVNFDGIYQRMNQMNESINQLGRSISNMKLVLDSGVVAGGVTDGVDMNIGRRSFYASRRN